MITIIFNTGEKEFFANRRYFPSEEVSRNSTIERPLRFPSATLPTRIPRDREGLLKQLESLSRDLCILYSRMAIFRMFRAFPKLKEKKKIFLEFLLTKNSFSLSPSLSSTPPLSTYSPLLSISTIDHENRANIPNNKDVINSTSQNDKIVVKEDSSSQIKVRKNNENKNENENENDDLYPINQIFILIRQSCAVTQRTKIYLQTVSMLHSISYLPQNIGSVFSAGGSPMLEQLRLSFTEMLSLNGKTSLKVMRYLCLFEYLLTYYLDI